MEDNQEELINVSKNVLLDLKQEEHIMKKRLDIMENTTPEEFIPFEPKRPFDALATFVENERELSMLQVKTHLDKLQGQIIGQEELIYKLSKEGEEEEKAKLEMIRENSDLKSQLKILELKNGEEE